MNCKGCNTRVPEGKKSCPHCGAEIKNPGSYSSSSRATVLPAPELSTARDDTDDFVELEDAADEEPPKPAPRPKAKKSPPPKKSAPKRAPDPEPAAPMVATDAESLRGILAEDPETLEAGLSVYTDAEGTPLGAGYASGVGDIDLLARSDEGELVVVMISDPDDEGETLVADVLQRIGWVRKHVATDQERVRGIVLCEQPPESLSYTAAAVADTVRFKTFRIALTFADLEL